MSPYAWTSNKTNKRMKSFNKRRAYNQSSPQEQGGKKRKYYKNNSFFCFVLQKCWWDKPNWTRGRGDVRLHEKCRTTPLEKTKKYKSSIRIFIKTMIFVKKKKKNTSQRKNKIYSALIRSSKSFWEETSSLFCYLCLGQCWWKLLFILLLLFILCR